MQLVYMIEYAIANRWIIPAAETIGIKCTPCQGNIINDMFEWLAIYIPNLYLSWILPYKILQFWQNLPAR